MKKDIFNGFIKDHFFFIIIFFVSNFLITLFYYISVGSSTELLYPACITIFMCLVFIIYRWIRYIEFNTKIRKLAQNINYDIQTHSWQEKELINLVNNIHQKYMEKISDIQFQDKNKKHLISQWIHNMKTPVSVIDLILQKALKDEIPMKKALEDINEENILLLDKLEQVLNFIRFEEFSEDYIPEVVDLTVTLRKVINKRKNQFIYSNVYPKLDYEEKSINVLTDEKWNEAMIDQIISNTIKYSNVEGMSKKVYFSFKKIEDKVILSIRDEGVGIPEHDLNRVFNPFFTGDNGRAFSKATGIGLYFCSQVAKKLGHNIEIESKVGEGTEMLITYLSKL